MPVKVDLVGQVFGQLSVLKFFGMTEDGMVRLWLCQCSCGGQATVSTKRLRTGITRSCGCLRASVTAARNTTHGLSKTPMYLLWSAMHSRCYNPNNRAYNRYGGRGIVVHPRWHSFEAFLSDVGEKPPGKSLDRIDNHGAYGPDNFRWATPVEQNSNRRDNVLVAMPDGQVVTKNEAARRIGVHRNALTRHLAKTGSYLGVTPWHPKTVK